MSRFSDKFIGSEISADLWKLNIDLVYLTDIVPNTQITVPKDFITDFYSIPPICDRIITKASLPKLPAVLHDYIYGRQMFSRHVCDKIFNEAMKDQGVPWRKRTLIYLAVRSFGWTRY